MSSTASVCPPPFLLSLASLKQKGVIFILSLLFLYSVYCKSVSETVIYCMLFILTDARI